MAHELVRGRPAVLESAPPYGGSPPQKVNNYVHPEVPTGTFTQRLCPRLFLWGGAPLGSMILICLFFLRVDWSPSVAAVVISW